MTEVQGQMRPRCLSRENLTYMRSAIVETLIRPRRVNQETRPMLREIRHDEDAR